MTNPIPCGWVPVGCTPVSGFGLDPELAQEWVSFAVDALWRATGSRYGACEITVRPCNDDCGASYWGGVPYPARVQGEWVNLTCSCAGSCGCGGYVSEVSLDGPVSGIEGLWLGSQHITGPAVTGYVRVDDYRKVVRIDGQRWPVCQNLGAPLSEDGTWGISYLKGHPVPAGGGAAAMELAVELIKGACGDSTCGLPKRINTIVRQGVTIAAIADQFDFLTKGGFGLYTVDAWLSSVNRHRKPSRFSTPDRPRPRMQTWP